VNPSEILLEADLNKKNLKILLKIVRLGMEIRIVCSNIAVPNRVRQSSLAQLVRASDC
jgi:hypothetical protein